MSKAVLVQRHTATFGATATRFLDALEPYVESVTEASEWPGTKLLTHTAKVFTFALSPAVASLLTNYSRSLFDWRPPELPEDLAFLRKDDSAWMVSTVHERDIYFHFHDGERQQLLARLPWLELSPS